MAQTNEVQALTKAFSGLGVDEKSFIAIGKWHPEQRQSFRKGTELFVQDERSFERWADEHVKKLTREFLRLKSAVVLWTMHPWERDARLIRDAVIDGAKSNNVIVEIACTRSSEELLGARRAYHSIFERSIEEDVAYNADGVERKLLVALVSAYRYEGTKVHEDVAKSEAKTLCGAIRNGAKKNPMEDDDVVRILSTRSKPHLRSVFKHYKEMCGKPIDEELVADSSLKDAVQCISTPSVYFIKVLDAAMNPNADENTKEGLPRVIVTRADHDMKEITEEYHKRTGGTLTERIGQVANGNFKDFLLTLLARGGFK